MVLDVSKIVSSCIKYYDLLWYQDFMLFFVMCLNYFSYIESDVDQVLLVIAKLLALEPLPTHGLLVHFNSLASDIFLTYLMTGVKI